MNENEVKKLYTALINKGFSANDIGDENTFVTKMGDQNVRKQFYDAISKTSFKIGDYDTFEKRLTSSDSPLSQEERAGYLMQGIVGKRNTSGVVDDFSAFADNMREYGDKAPVSQNMGQSIESSRMFNPESGKMEKTYVTPSGSRYNNKNLADFEVSRYREAADMTVNGQLRRARAKLEELQAKKADRTSEVHDEAMEFNESKLTGLGQMLVGGDIYVAKQRGDSQKGALDVAIRQTEELIKDLEEQKDRDKGVDVGYWRGVGRTMGDSRTWDFGIGNMGDAITMLHSDKLADENATEGEKDAYNEMMSALYNKEQADRMYGDNRDFWYKAGVTTGYMPSFMIDFIATGAGYKGLNLLSKGGAKAATKIVGKEISEEIAEKGFKQFVKDNGVKGFMQYGTDWTVKALGTMGDDLLVRAPMMANTVQFGKTASDIIDRKLGDVVVNEDGSYDFANDETWSSAIWQGEANAIVENFSEMFGGHLGQVVDLGKLGKLANVIGAKRLGNILTQADAGSLGGIMGQTQRLFNEMGVGDYFGEVTEEFYGQLWRTVFNLDDAYIQNPDGTRTNLFATSEFYGDVLGGMALSMGLMGAAKTTYTGARYASAKHNVNKADKRAAVLFGDEWEGIRATIDNTTNDNMGTLIQSVLAENYSTKEMNAILSYMESSMVLRGFNLGTLARSRGEQNEVAQQVNESYLDGYNASTPQEMNNAQNMYEHQREKALLFFTETELETIANNPVVHIDAYSGEHRDVLLDYINAKQVRDGMIQRVRDDIDSRIEESNTMVDSRTNTDTGMIQGATMKVDDRKVYVVKGNLVQYDDKSGINNSASSESVIIRDAQTGKIEIVSPDAILNIDDAIDPNEEKATAAEVIRTTYAQAEADKMEGKLTFNPGDTYTLDTENGQMQVQITANEQGIVDNGDGTINVTDGQNIFPVTKQTFQDQVDAANKARVAQYDALQQAERSMENTPEYALNDKVVLRDANGNTINGQIAEVFADDGYYIVDVDVPINGSYAARMTRDELNNMLVEHNGVNVNTPSVPAQQAQSAPVTPTPSQQAQTPAAPQSNTALSRIPTDAQGNPIYEQTDADTAWDAIVEQTEGDEAMAQSVAESMLKDKQTALSKAEKMQVKGGVTIAEKIAAEKERKAIIANAQREVELWQQIAGTVQRRQAAAEVQRKIEEEKRRIAEEAAAQQAKVEEEQPQVQTNQEELAVEDSEQEVADVASESEEKIDDSTIGEQITEQETPVQAEEQVQAEESPAESQVTEQAETPTSAQPKESKNAKKLRKRAEKWMKDAGVTVRLLNSIDEVTNKAARAALEAGNPVSGWFSNNEVVLYMPNINSVEEIDKTFIHEVVAHKGLRMLMGEKFDALCDNVWDMMSEEDRAKYIKYPGVKGNTRKAADEYMAYLAEGVDLNKTIWQKIIDAVKEFFSSKDVTLLDEEIANLIKESYKNLKAQAATNVNNEVASIDGNDAMFSIKTYREGGRDILQKFLKGRVKAKDLTKAEAEEMLNQMDEIYAICEEFKDKYAPFGNWSEAAVVVDEDGKPVFSVIKPNGDYAMNLDFSLVCKKRRTLDAVFREMINRGIISDYDLGQVDIAKINDIIRKYGFETACRLCFVDAKRFRVAMVADAFVGIYNPLTKMTDQQLQNVSKQMGDATEGKIARMLLKNPENRIQLSRDNFMDSKGFEDIKANKAEIMSLYNAKKGTGGPKAALGDVQYLNDILKKRWSPKTAYSVGGVRLQSFSDYVPRMVFDYIQMIADLAAKKLPVHSYTKEVLFAQTFGLTGMKINLSLVPKVVEGGVAPGLDTEGNYAWQEGETFPYEEAMKLQNAEGYKENCGTIAVGVSDEHIQKLLDDENIRMVIPYHKSGLNKQVAIHNNIDQFVDYTNEQNTRNADGKKLSEEQAKKHFNFNSDLQKHGNPRKAAENYLEWCRKNNYLPKFDKFQNHPNYYKLLEDFTTCITENGVDTFVPQGAVKMNFPTNESAFGSLSELIERGLEEDAILEGMKSEKIGPIVDDIQKALDEGQTMFRVANNNQEIFVSNARKAVESIEQEKATPEQWLAMLQKNGGLKAGEDKWMGLSDWLKESKSKTLRKQDVLDFVNENAIKIEEVKYALEPINSLRDSLANNKGEDFANEFIRSFGVEDSMLVMNDVQGSIDLYNNDNNANIQLDENGEWKTENDEDVIFEWAHNVLFNADNNTSVSHKTRTYYVTKGLENNREIALVVPTIESWNNGDEIHFGDAGDGRAIAWIRFGQTTDEEGNHVLVIDEIQSKRHQEGRDKGYRPNTEIYLKKNGIEVKESDEFYEFYKNGELDRRFAKDILKNIKKAKDLYVSGLSQTDVPDAPFEKNWHELAFKRMLRLAAEEGFDKVAWATGEQQAQRYALSNGEGMKSFYDKMIPSFVSKYTKKWGAKVGEVTMPNLEENNTMWSVDITPEMQESVMEGQTMFRISEEQDKAYIDAVEVGDMETAQAMVDSAAQAAGYNSPRLYHGTKSEFNVFNAKHNDPGSKGFFFTDSEEMASSYGKNIKQVYLRVEDPYVIEGNGRNWNNLHTDIFSVIPEIEDQIRAHEIAMKRFLENGDIKQSQYDYFRDKYYDKVDFIKDESKNSIFDIIKKYIYRWQIRNFNSKLNVDRTRDFEWLLQQLDSDVNIIFKDITDYGANITDYESIFTPHDVYVTTNPKNIKSADAVTYDDNGNVIPLSERFNEENDDIRFRVSEAKDKIKEIIGADGSSNKSIYAEGKTESGEKWVIRVSDHPARIENFKDKNEDADYILSIIIDEDFDSEFAHKWYHPITNDENTWQVVVNPKNIDYDVLSKGIDRFKRTGDGSLVWDGKTETMFRIRPITDKERQTMINALSLSEGEEFYDNVFNGADQVVRENIVAIAAKNGWDFRKATEEYLGSLADNNPRFNEVKQIGLWDKVKGFFVDMLNKIGLNGFTKDSLADNDLRYILWRRFKNPKGRQDLFEKAEDIAKQYELGVGDYAEEDGDTLFRTNSSIRDRYDRAVRVPNKSGSVKWHENSLRRLKEAYYDGMHALKKLQDLIAEETGKPIQSYENSYEAENHMSSENKAQAEIFERDFFNPLKKVVQSLIKLGSSYEKLKTYIIAKHGLERNAYMRNKAVQNGENGDRDFSGLTDLTGIENVADAEIEAQRIVDEYEKKYDTTELWEKINAATKETLRKSYDSGLISKETYEEVRDMYKYYIPLRGWDIDVASDEYEYLNSGRIMLSPALNKAKGRTSLADDPLATIGFMAESTIIQGNRNKVKMKFLNMALNHPTDLISVSEQWYVLDNATGEWEPRNPIIPDGATGDQVAAIVEQHEQQMIALGDKATKIKDGLKLNKNITKREGQEHVVRVKRNGKEYCLYINGSPRAAQAINGLLNPDINNSGLKKVANAIKHWMAAMFTSKNPTFIFLNLSRDVIWAGTSVAIKENAAYNARYTKNIAECLLKAQLPRLLKKFQNGTLDMNNELERYFDEFIRNGGETGFTQLHGVDDYKRNINRFVKEAQGKGFIVKKTWDGMIDNIEFMNRCAEDITRFMVYMTSRQMGRDVMTSVTDAKEITVNFNRKGSGGLGASLFNFCYLFFNASIQSAANFGKLLVKHPKKSAIALTLFSSAGFLVPMLNMAIKAMFSDDEDDNSYWDLPEWIRRNNIVLYVPWTESGYLTIPVPHELRPFYGMGEIAFSCLMGKEDVEDGLKKASLGFTQLIPLDFTGNGGNFWVNITPTIGQPIAQIITNKDYFGKPIYKKNDWNERSPEWTKAYKSTTPWLIDATKWLNEISGGDNVKKGKIDLNPALIEHIFESYTGGTGKTLNNAQKTFAMLWNEDLREWRNVPIIGSFYRTTEEQTAGSQINREYYEAVEEMKDVQHLVNGYKRELRMGNLEYAEKIDELINSEIFKRYGVIYEFSNAIKEASDYLKLIDDTTDREKIETGIMNLKVDMFKKLEEINKVEELKNAEIAEEGNDDRK